jgi:hypothetical protein
MADDDKKKESSVTEDKNANVSPTVSPAEFTKIPLEFIIATPLLTTIEAHKAAASVTLNFIESLKDKTVNFKINSDVSDAAGKSSRGQEVIVPLLSVVKVPYLTFDSLSVNFNYNISQVYRQEDKSLQKAELKASTKGALAAFIDASLTGSIEHSRTRENVSNRGGSLEIKLHISETQIPAGLDKVISAIVENISLPDGPKK